MKTLLLILLTAFTVFGTSTRVLSQTYGNEWINYSQKYFKFPITQTGLFRISPALLASAGIPATTLVSSMKIYGRAQEVPVFVFDDGNGTLETGDYLEFYAERNDGWFDSTLYSDPKHIGNPNYSLYNDTIYYFFTIDASSAALRYTEETDVNFVPYTPVDYVWDLEKLDYRNNYSEGYKFTGVSSSFYTAGEGWGSAPFNAVPGGSTFNQTFLTTSLYTGINAPNSKFHGKSVSMNNADVALPSSGNHHLQWLIGGGSYLMADSSWFGYNQWVVNRTLVPGTIQDGATNLSFRLVDDLGVLTDLQSFQYAQLEYPRTTNFAFSTAEKWKIPTPTVGAKSLLNFTGMSNAEYHGFTLGSNKVKLKLQWNGTDYQTLVPNSTESEQPIYIQLASTILDITSLVLINSSGNFTNFAALPIDSALIVVYPPTLQASVSNYAAYRNSILGGQHNVLLADIEELYLQYGAGIPKHVLAIRNFVKDIHASAPIKPVGLFLFGKGVREASESGTFAGIGARISGANYDKNLLPSYGFPSSDYAITAGLVPGSPWEPLIPTGRLAVSDNATADLYLAKLITYENQQVQSSIYDIPLKQWQKQVLHFGGGSSETEQSDFKYYLQGMESIIEGSKFAGNVKSFYKTVSDPINPVTLTNINGLLQEGASLMNFFGHASADGFDQNIDEPINWNNQDKYPVVIGNACYTGDIFQPNALSTSERFLLIANEGAIGFLSSVKYGYAGYLNTYTTKLYQQFSSLSYGLPLAEQIKKNIASVYSGSNDPYLESTCLQMAFHGDPIMKLNWHKKPEIHISIENTYVTPSFIDLETDSITLNIVVSNLGRSIDSLITIQVIRDFPLLTEDSIYTITLPYLNYNDTVKLKMPLQPNVSIGINSFNISIDLPSLFPEQYDELSNNQITKTLFVNIDGILPVEPYDYAVVPNPSVTVKASTINPIAPLNTYVFEIDTTDLFNSPDQHRYYKVTGLGGVKEVDPSQWLDFTTNLSSPLVCTDSMVYFWRVAVDSTTPTWRESSFQYITGKTGWGQDHFFQFKNNNFSNVNYNRPNRDREFGPRLATLNCKVTNLPVTSDGYNLQWYKIDGDIKESNMCGLTPSIHVAVIDPISLLPWGKRWNHPTNGTQNPTHGFGNYNDYSVCRNRIEYYFVFQQNSPTKLAAFRNMVETQVPDGHYLLIYSTMEANFANWDLLDSTLFNTFRNLGSTLLTDSLQSSKSFIFFTKKGDASTVVETTSNIPQQSFELNASMVSSAIIGEETSTLIGPASDWKTIYWKQNSVEPITNDSTRLRIQALNAQGNVLQTIDTVFSVQDSMLNVNALLPAATYPYLRLNAYYKDAVTFSPAQNNRWHVLYQPLPEAAIDGSVAYTWLPQRDTLEEGEQVQFAADIKNIYTLDMDSLLVSYWIEDENHVKHPIAYTRQDSLKVGETFRDTVTFNSLGLAGINSFWMEVNPYLTGSSIITDQPEQVHFNNLLERAFYVNGDDINPILDVTFNGQRILNGDIIAPDNEIVISLKDDNSFLVMDQDSDTTLFGIYLTDPNGIQTRIPFVDGAGNQIMQWIPANASNKRFKIIHPAIFLLDGTYKLQVQGSDRSGNLSGNFDYKVEFEIIHESSITYMMNYPNPFSTSTRFVFTLTGSVVPEEMIIQIMTVTGKVVREITEDEIGTMQIGRNISEYAWDGKDEFGDFLANGVYLYHVIAKINGEDIKHRDSGADNHFKKDFGKMYILR